MKRGLFAAAEFPAASDFVMSENCVVVVGTPNETAKLAGLTSATGTAVDNTGLEVEAGFDSGSGFFSTRFSCRGTFPCSESKVAGTGEV